MSGDAQLQLQKAVNTALVAALSPAKVFDHLPKGTTFPYVVIGEGDVSEFDTDTEIGQDHRVTVHAYTRDTKGKRAVKELQKKIYDALHLQALTLEAGAALVHIHWEFSDAILDPDGETYHGVSRFRVLTTEA